MYKYISTVCIAALCYWPAVRAQVVISELLWVGSEQSSADEWIELQVLPTFTGSFVSVSNWQLMALDSNGEPKLLHAFASGAIIPAVRPYIIANFTAEDSHLTIEPDIVTSAVSLLNSKLFVWLQDETGNIVDQVDDGKGTPFAGGKIGDPPMYVSMERISVTGSGVLKANWRDAEIAQNIISGSLVIGTPGCQAVVHASSNSSSSVGNQSSSLSASGAISSILSASGASSSMATTSGSNATQLIPWVYTQLFIAELLPNPVGSDDDEWIKLGFHGTGSLTLSGVTVSDASGTTYMLRSDTLILSGGTLLLTKDVTGITLNNTSDTVLLHYKNVLLDTFTYAQLPEGISATRNSSGTLLPICTPILQEDQDQTTLLPIIEMQSTTGMFTASGVLVATGSLQFNVHITASGGLHNTSCVVTSSDGWQSASCNPSSHTIMQSGTGILQVETTNYCGTTAIQSINYIVYNKVNSSSNTAQNKLDTTAKKTGCVPSMVSGIFITEILPNPILTEAEGEWIELHNPNDFRADLCGWQLDDVADAGSRPFSLEDIHIPTNGYIVLNRQQTKIALNNTNESVRLLAPVMLEPNSPVKEVQIITYKQANEGQSLAVRNDDEWLWTPYTSPGEGNVFKTATRSFSANTITVSAALPNPAGKDSAATEWIELSNATEEQQQLVGKWSVATPNGNKFILDSIVLEPREVQRFYGKKTGLQLTNSVGEVQLLDPLGYIHSVLSWQNAKENTVYRAIAPQGAKIAAQVTGIAADGALLVQFTDPDELKLLPPSVKRAWLVAAQRANPVLPVQLLGVHTLPNALSATEWLANAVVGKLVYIQFDAEVWHSHTTTLAYVYIQDSLVQTAMLQSGQAAASSRYNHPFQAFFSALEQEATQAKLGVWAQPELSLQLLAAKNTAEIDAMVAANGLQVEFSVQSGLVESGALLTLTPSAPSVLYVSISSGAYQLHTGSVILQHNTLIQAYAERSISGSGAQLIRSAVITGEYVIKQPLYSTGVFISEVYPSPRPGKQEWIELFNSTATTVDVSGWQLDDESSGSKPYTLPIGTIIGPNSTLLFLKNQTNIAFNNNGDEAWLVTPTGQVVASVQYGTVALEQSVMFTGSVLHSLQVGCISAIPTPNVFTGCITLPPKAELPDTDNDLLPDVYEELAYNTNPTMADTDGDGWLDSFEVEVGEDLPPVAQSSRAVRMRYKAFIGKHVSVRFRRLKTKPSRLYGKAVAQAQVQVHIPSVGVTLQPIVQSGAWRADLPVLASGSYMATVTFTDVAGTKSTNVVTFAVPNIAKKTAVVKQIAVPSWARFKQLYVAGFLQPVDTHLLRLFTTSRPQNGRTINVVHIGLLLLVLGIFVATFCFLRKNAISAIIRRLWRNQNT